MSKFLTLVLLVVSLQAKADADVTNWFYGLFSQQLNALQTAGINQVSGKSIDDLKLKARQIKVTTKQFINYQNNVTDLWSRESAFWDPSQNTIFVSEQHLKAATIQQIKDISLHEYFRALDIFDENFGHSSMISYYFLIHKILTKNPDIIKNKVTLPALKLLIESATLPNEAFKIELAMNGGSKNSPPEGGTSGTGGGGDIRILDFKTKVISEIVFDFDRNLINTSQFIDALVFLSKLKIEVSHEVGSGTYLFDADKKVFLLPTDVYSGQSFADKFAETLAKAIDQRKGQ